MTGPLRRVLVRRPDAAFAVDDPVLWHYAGRPHLPTAQHEHDALVSIMRAAGVEVVYHDVDLPAHADAVFVFDPVLITDQGAVLLSMGKELRRGEEAAMAAVLSRLGVPVLYSLHDEARAEGGDLLWLDHDTLAVGQGFRTNDEGLRQLQEVLAPLNVRVLGIDLPFDGGPQACLHLLSLISLIDDDLAVVFEPLLPVPLWHELRRRGVRLLRVPEHEFRQTMGTNVLALAPRRCVMLEGSPVTRSLLEEAGCEVRTYRGDELSLKAEGGPTCLTRPLLRQGH
jgi:N-dimethylarginine dimethylaminohydrolase